MTEIENFYNDGTGWVCKRCEQTQAVSAEVESAHSRFFREGEAESKFPTLSAPCRARWLDRLRETLICPICGVTEKVDKR